MIATQEPNNELRTRPFPACYLCGSQGEPLYSDLKDHLFGAPGEWSFKKCPNSECGLVWLDPMPIEEDIAKAYRDYYTHKKESKDKADLGLEIILKKIIKLLYKGILLITLIRRERRRHNLMYLDKTKPGILIEVGCGDGSRLNKIRKLGWEVEGQEVDPQAANIARSKYGLSVHMGDLKSLRLKESSFDAVIMNHVIEHVHDPVDILRECHRILKPNGMLVVITPNIESYGHRYFGADCRMLEPPRHIHLFSQKTLSRLAFEAGFQSIKVWTTASDAESIARGSYKIRSYKTGGESVLSGFVSSILFQMRASILHLFQPDSGEECVLKAYK
ncbi:MAG: hypothetical protein A2Z47_14375 [Thermodesulfovibrio sp. RBG_19FT_COMBO_42_12]|nr:MAG: hypothetical protein A2Z47_14375 [Thermodesulfovibrio sp. RBG_19FT_COMBO_42_12]